MIRLFIFLILFFSSPTFSKDHTYADCILENLKNVSSDVAAEAIIKACEEKYNKNEVSDNQTIEKETKSLKDEPFDQTYRVNLRITKLGVYWDEPRIKVDDILPVEIVFENKKKVFITMLLDDKFDSYYFNIQSERLKIGIPNTFNIKTTARIASSNTCTYRTNWRGKISNQLIKGLMQLRCESANLGDILLLEGSFSN